MTTMIFPEAEIPLHVAIVKSLEEVIEKMAVVDHVEDHLQAAHLLLKIAELADTAQDYFANIRDCALQGMEIRLPEAFIRITARRLASIEADAACTATNAPCM
jgi:hypothetical protein